MKFTLTNEQLPMEVLALFLAILLILTEFFGVLMPIRQRMERLLIPWQARGAKVARLMLTPFFFLEKTVKDYHYTQDLELRLSEALAETERLSMLEEENAELRELLSLPEPKSGQRSLGVSILSYGRPLIQLSNATIPSLGSPVLTHGTVVARVTGIQGDFLELVLLSERQSQALLVKTQSGAEGILIGNGKQIILTEVDREASLQAGDQIYTMGQEAVPPGLFVGRIQRINTPDSSPVQTAVIEQLESFYENTVVEIRGSDTP